MRTNRRDFIKAISVPVAGALLIPGCARKPHGPYLVLSALEADTLIALCEQLIPADDYAGATEAGVVYFFDKQLSNRGNYSEQLAFYQQGLAIVNNCCRNLHNTSFAKMDIEAQYDFLKKLEGGKVADKSWKMADQRKFFNTLLDHTMQAFYGAPRHGGNKQYVSYAMMGIQYPLVIGQNRYDHLENE
ncbi:MAG: gluconate 2-dehydrogenase subunit 3 family protein [Puniceicoccaceae bacterium]